MDLGLSGLASGFDWRALIEQLNGVERAPQNRLRTEQITLDLRKNAYTSIATQLGILKNRVDALKDPLLYESRKASVSDASMASANASVGAAIGSYSINVSQLATSSRLTGVSNVGSSVHNSNDVSQLIIGEMPIALAPSSGTFTIDGSQVSIASSDTLQIVFDKIATATGGTVTGSYDSNSDRISLSSSNEIILGSATDSSNFLQAAKLLNNGTGSILSASPLGVLRLNKSLETANFATPITGDGTNTGELRINGQTISFDIATDTVADVLARINNASAGVTASYDAINDRLVLTNKITGDLGISLEDVTGNFLSATGLSVGTLQRGTNLLYSVNDDGQLTSQSNVISESSSSIPGLNITVNKTGSFSIDVASDEERIKSAIIDFITEYNKSQSLIDSETASSTNADGEVTAGELAGELEAKELAGKLRQLVNSIVSSSSGTVRNLDSLGVRSNGTDDTISLTDQTAFDAAISNNLDSVKSLFANKVDGLAIQLDAYLEKAVGDEGLLITKQSSLTRQIADIDSQIAGMERLVLANEARLIESFLAMELAQSEINQQMQFLQDRFGGTAS